MASPRRKLGRPVDPALPHRRREEILAAATGFFARNGYLNADVQVLATQLGVGKGTIYRYFGSKERLFRSALMRGLGSLHSEVAAATEGTEDDGVAALRGAITAYLAFFDRHPELIELIVLERAELKGRGKPTYFAHRERYLGPWRKRLNGLMACGSLRRMDVDAIIDGVGMLLYGALVTHPFIAGRGGLEAKARAVLDLVLHGIGAERSVR
jgi:AcrR family transcriptional regulator